MCALSCSWSRALFRVCARAWAFASACERARSHGRTVVRVSASGQLNARECVRSWSRVSSGS
eukprot:4307434-Pleurochrysis_carterae.AAC.3